METSTGNWQRLVQRVNSALWLSDSPQEKRDFLFASSLSYDKPVYLVCFPVMGNVWICHLITKWLFVDRVKRPRIPVQPAALARVVLFMFDYEQKYMKDCNFLSINPHLQLDINIKIYDLSQWLNLKLVSLEAFSNYLNWMPETKLNVYINFCCTLYLLQEWYCRVN